MAQPYPKTFTKADTQFRVPKPANDNIAGRIPFRTPSPANDNFPARRMIPEVKPVPLRRIPGLRLSTALSAFAAGALIYQYAIEPRLTGRSGLPLEQPGWEIDVFCRTDPGRFTGYGSLYCGPQIEGFYPEPGGAQYADGFWRVSEFSGRYYDDGTLGPYYLFHRLWQRPGVPEVEPDFNYGRGVPSIPYEWPQVVPNYSPSPVSYPLSNPFPRPTPVPLVPQLPSTSPSGEPIRGNGVPQGAFTPSPRPNAEPDPRPQRPQRGEKERKVRGLYVTGAPASIIGMATESMDAVEAVYWALPKALRKKLWKEHHGYMSPLDKALAIYRYADQLDIAVALANLGAEWAEDMVWGSLGRLTADANRIRGAIGGAELGPALEGGPSFNFKLV